MNNEEYVFRMHEQEGITLIIESPPVQGENDEIKHASAQTLMADIVECHEDWYLEEIFEIQTNIKKHERVVNNESRIK